MLMSTTPALLSLLSLGFLWVSNASATVYDNYEQSFLFDWTGDQSPPVPTATQCASLPITWGRRGAMGPDAQAPFFLQVYTSAFIVPFVIPAGSFPSADGFAFNWSLPFNPGTLFQVCMLANNGVTGGCQDIFTVLPNANATPENPPICQNLTYPQGALDVNAQVQGGIMSQSGWVPQCTDIALTPRNGTPPYTYTIAPSLRPPINFTSDTADTQNWTVSLPYGMSFWVSVQDSQGWSWTNGPIHASNGSTSCLVATSSSATSKGLSAGGAVGVAIGTLLIGGIIGSIGACLLFRRSAKSGEKDDDTDGFPFARKVSDWAHEQHGSSRPSRNGIDPFLLSHETSTRSPDSTDSPVLNIGHDGTHSDAVSPVSGTTSSAAHTAGVTSPTGSGATGLGQGGSHVYVVHHDAGRPPPVTVFTSDGTEVVELPPQYESAAGSPRHSAQPPPPPGPQQRQRQPRELPAKPSSAGSS